MLEATDPAADAAVHQCIDDILAAVTRRMEQQLWPAATYRVQLNAGCQFHEVTAAVPYLASLGVSDLYASPFLEARPGSLHGYDIVNHSAINPEIGTLDDLQALRSALRERNLGLIADVVPNHMSASPQLNAWWQDVLENGPSSAYASYFDIDWMPLKPDLANKVLLPVLGDQFGKVLEEGHLQVRYGDGSFWLAYFDQRFPIAPGTYAVLLSSGLDELQERLGAEQVEVLELFSILTAIKNLPSRTETDEARLAERRREKEVIKRRLHELVDRSPDIAAFVEQNLQEINGQVGDPRSFDRLDALLQDQCYRLSYWRVASDEINYRRFFDINDLAAICTESPAVFAETHRLVFDLLDRGTLTGLRIDHPDGLYDPWRYLYQLQEAHFLRFCRAEPQFQAIPEEERAAVEQRLVELWRVTADIPGSPLARPLFLVVEKILAPDEMLPENWPVHGTVGYEFLNALSGVFVDPRSERSLSTHYERFTGQSPDFAELAYLCKRLIVRMSMASELNVLGDRLDRLSERNRLTRDFTLSSLTRALQEVVAQFSVYRTYVQPGHVLERDIHYVERAVARAKRRNPAMSSVIFDFVRDVLLLRWPQDGDEQEREAVQRFTGKFQQVTGPVMAKAVEDTAFYRFNRLISLNEVGGEPAMYGVAPARFHQMNQSRLPRLSHALSATSTHDTKRSEDVRARINVLSEIPREWRDKVQAWSRQHRRLKAEVEGSEAPSRNAEYLLYQTLIGIWPDVIPTGAARETFLDRVQQYMLKVEREAKVNTSWISPHEAYEAALSQFVANLFAGDRRRSFVNDLHEFASRVAEHGRWNALSQLVLKLTSPGVADFYQGTELWNLTLVDPDNRHPVDFAARQQALSELQTELARLWPGSPPDTVADSWLSHVWHGNSDLTSPLPQPLLDTRRDGRIKLYVTWLGLQARRRDRELFTTADYLPLAVTGQYAENVIAFARRRGSQLAVIVVPRLTVRLTGFGGPPPIGDTWADTAVQLPTDLVSNPPQLCELFTGQTLAAQATLPVRSALNRFPVSVWFGPLGP